MYKIAKQLISPIDESVLLGLISQSQERIELHSRSIVRHGNTAKNVDRLQLFSTIQSKYIPAKLF